MSDTYKKIIKLQQSDSAVRERINQWLIDNVNKDLDCLQSLVMDSDGFFVPAPEGGWHEADDEFNSQLQAGKEKIYSQILDFLNGAEPEAPKPKEEPKKPSLEKESVAAAVVTILNAGKNVNEDKIREIVRDELSKLLTNIKISI